MTTATQENIFKRIMQSDLAQKIIKDDAADLLKKRKEASTAIESLTISKEKTIQGLLDLEAIEKAKVEQVQEKLKLAQEKYRASMRKRQAEDFRLNHLIEQHEKYLRSSYDPAIDEFLSWVNGRLESLRHTQPERLKSAWLVDGTLCEEYDTAGLAKARESVGNAYEQGQAMKMKYCSDVPGELAKLRDSILRNVYTNGWL